MTYLELYQLFLIFLDSEGALDKYQNVMNQSLNDRWDGGTFTTKPNEPSRWLFDAFSWQLHDGWNYWNNVAVGWNTLLKTIEETHQLG